MSERVAASLSRYIYVLALIVLIVAIILKFQDVPGLYKRSEFWIWVVLICGFAAIVIRRFLRLRSSSEKLSTKNQSDS
jgi:hypothetical protein